MGRIKAIIVKEFFHILRDPRSLTMVFITPLVMIFILGYSVSYDLNRIDAAVIDLSQSRLSQAAGPGLCRQSRLRHPHPRQPWPRRALSLAAAEEMLRQQKIKEIIVIPADLSRRLAAQRQGDIGLIIDGSDTNIANLVYQYDERIILEFIAAMKGAGQLLKIDTKIYLQSRGPQPVFLHPRPGRRHPADDLGHAHLAEHCQGEGNRLHRPAFHLAAEIAARSSSARPSPTSSSPCSTAWSSCSSPASGSAFPCAAACWCCCSSPCSTSSPAWPWAS